MLPKRHLILDVFIALSMSFQSVAFSQQQDSSQSEEPPGHTTGTSAECGNTTAFSAFDDSTWTTGKIPHSPRRFPTEASYAKASFHPSGDLLAGSSGNSVFIWNLNDSADIAKLPGHRDRITSVSFSPKGDRIISASKDKTARIWSVADESSLLTLDGHEDVVLTASFSSDGARAITADRTGVARVWDAQSGKLLFNLPKLPGEIYTASFSPDGLQIVTGSADRISRVWDVNSRKELTRFTQHAAGVTSASFSKDGSNILSAAFDGTAYVWNPGNGEAIFRLEQQNPRTVSAAYSSDGTYIVTGETDGSARIRDAKSGVIIQTMRGHIGDVYPAVNADASKIATTDANGLGLLWDAHNVANEVTVHGFGKNDNPDVRFSVDGKQLVVDQFNQNLSAIDTVSGKISSVIPWIRGRNSYSNPITPDGKRFAKIEQSNGLFDIVIRAVDSGKVLTRLKGHGTQPNLAFSRFGTRIITSNQYGMGFWNGETGELIWEQDRKVMTGNLVDHSLNHDGTLLATRDGDVLRLWNCESGELLHNFSPDSSEDIAFSVDNRFLVTTHFNSIHIWNPSSGVEIQKITTRDQPIQSILISEDSSLLLARSNRSVFVHDRETGDELASFVSEFIPLAVSFSSEGIVIAEKTYSDAGELGIRLIHIRLSAPPAR
jgi:WD40 repeat protein